MSLSACPVGAWPAFLFRLGLWGFLLTFVLLVALETATIILFFFVGLLLIYSDGITHPCHLSMWHALLLERFEQLVARVVMTDPVAHDLGEFSRHVNHDELIV